MMNSIWNNYSTLLNKFIYVLQAEIQNEAEAKESNILKYVKALIMGGQSALFKIQSLFIHLLNKYLLSTS